jgi:hypothetical protein
MLAQYRNEAESFRQQLMDSARREAERARQQWFEALQREREELLQDFRQRLGQAVFTLASQALKELANADLEEQILKVFVERLRTLDSAKREEIVEAVRNSGRFAIRIPKSRSARRSRFPRKHGSDCRMHCVNNWTTVSACASPPRRS